MDVQTEPSGPAVMAPTVPPPPSMASAQIQPEASPAGAIKRRAPIACRSVFPVRGQPDQDREYRHPRLRADKSKKREAAKLRRESLDAPALLRSNLPGAAGLTKGADDWDLLPPLPEIIEAVNKFTRHYFQLGFIPKQLFPERLRTQHRSVSVFFLLGILGVSARLTPPLVERYGSAVKASEVFMERASALAQHELYREPTLERCQAFYLLSIAQQGSGMKHRSSINMAISMRMATLMQLHREETYVIPSPTKELVIRAESARRTLWMLHSQDNLHSGPRAPVLLSASDITALLPSNEEDFANAREPKSRAALEDTPPAVENPALVADEGRSLFATLIQAHHFWGAIYRRAINNNKSPRPWEPDSEYAKMERRLAEWEAGLPNDYRWSNLLLKGHKHEGQDLAYLGVTMITRLCNIVIRKAHLHEFYKSPNVTTVGTEGSMADSKEPIPHVLHPTGNRPPVKPIQPRIVAPVPDEKNGIPTQSPNLPMLSLAPQQQAVAAMYPEPGMRVPVPQQGQNQAQQGVPSHGAHGPPHVVGPRPTTDGLGLLIEAFDTHQTTPAPVPGTTSAPPPHPPGAVYDPHTAPQQYYAQPALAMNDGYEHELGYYMSDTVQPVMQHSWAANGDMYGY
ncbi:hypothetical protein NEMBOFW57_001619 [Staphylotrichum longicolle]|uniref:Xylanolytic transcriptional activator regulatory domain-containing protein n=1 Tax=Staphylotrichum longicolle TaxID=669026 RepID=A0AAD4I2S3_9PEZI|nr:hypothetical protein NEMBOFW57_001619 [Staphylotrichum longicolle]